MILTKTQDVLQSMADALPTHEPNDTTSDLSSSHEALALFTHACMVSHDFRLLGFDEDKTIEAQCRQLAPRLPANWNASFNIYTFVYAHQQSTHRFVIKIDRMGGRAEIRGMAVGDEHTARVQITTKDFVSNTELPVRIIMTQDGVEDRSDLRQKLLGIFVSAPQVASLTTLINSEIIRRLLPSAQTDSVKKTPGGKDNLASLNEGTRESPDDVAVREDAKEAARRPPTIPRPRDLPDTVFQPAAQDIYEGPFAPMPRPALPPLPAGDFPPPGFEDTYDLNRRRTSNQPDRSPFGNIGADDLNPPPLGPYDPLRGNYPGGLRNPGRTPGGARGMHPTFDDPLFGTGGGSGGEFDDPHFGGIGGGGQGGFDPQVPPGARYDPLGPGGGPRLGGRTHGPGNHPFGGRGGFGGFGSGDII
ncbi:putative PI31 proteasome regulator [Rosellinia necatrix]|uniref:Putative PI31 proteasome regulator n=1 Tax=Rosellinia necatrix TaxID=77044 RepID=A0A1W2TUM3_ROSNE|nr:putative PI31 proteasome regulator [Rosellinia necatrix]